MLGKRLLDVGGNDEDNIVVRAAKGCPQSGVPFPLLWCFVVDSLLNEFQDLGVHIQCKHKTYADDVCELVSERYLKNICNTMRKVLDRIDALWNQQGLSVNPIKTGMVLFTHKWDRDGLTLPKLRGEIFQLSSEVKYLGVTQDHKLTGKLNVDQKVQGAFAISWQCRRDVEKVWGLIPAMVNLLFTATVTAMVAYTSVVWLRSTLVKFADTALCRLQRSVCLGITGTMSTTPGGTLSIRRLPWFIKSYIFRSKQRKRHADSR